MKINKIIKNISAYVKGFYYAVTDGNTKLLHLAQFEHIKNNLEFIIYGVKASAAHAIRISYNEEINNVKINYLKLFAETHTKNMCFTEELAIKVSNIREEIKLAKQSETPFLGRFKIYARNIEKYNDKNGPSKEYKLKQLKADPEVFAYKALMTDGKDLEAEGNDFRYVVNEWINTRGPDTIVYPEDLIGKIHSPVKVFFDISF